MRRLGDHLPPLQAGGAPYQFRLAQVVVDRIRIEKHLAARVEAEVLDGKGVAACRTAVAAAHAQPRPAVRGDRVDQRTAAELQLVHQRRNLGHRGVSEYVQRARAVVLRHPEVAVERRIAHQECCDSRLRERRKDTRRILSAQTRPPPPLSLGPLRRSASKALHESVETAICPLYRLLHREKRNP